MKILTEKLSPVVSDKVVMDSSVKDWTIFAGYEIELFAMDPMRTFGYNSM